MTTLETYIWKVALILVVLAIATVWLWAEEVLDRVFAEPIMVVLTGLAGLVLAGTLACAGKVVYTGAEPGKEYTIHKRVMYYDFDTQTWLPSCAIIAHTWEGYDQYTEDYEKPVCPVVVWPDEAPPEGGMRNYKPVELE